MSLPAALGHALEKSILYAVLQITKGMEKSRPGKLSSASAASSKNALGEQPYKAALAPTMRKTTLVKATIAATAAQMAALTVEPEVEPEFEQEWPDTVFLVRSCVLI